MSDEVMQETTQKLQQLMFAVPQMLSIKAQLKQKKLEKTENQEAIERFAKGNSFFQGKPFVYTGTTYDLCFFYAEKAMPVSCIESIKDAQLRDNVVGSFKKLREQGLVELKSVNGNDAFFITKEGKKYIDNEVFFSESKRQQNIKAANGKAPVGVGTETSTYKFLGNESDLCVFRGVKSVNINEICSLLDEATAARVMNTFIDASHFKGSPPISLIDLGKDGVAQLTKHGEELLQSSEWIAKYPIDKYKCFVEEALVGTAEAQRATIEPLMFHNLDDALETISSGECLEQPIILCDKENPKNYMIATSEKSIYPESGKTYICTKFDVYNDGVKQQCNKFKHGEFTRHTSTKGEQTSNKGKENWLELKDEIKSKSGMGNDLVCFTSKEQYEMFAKHSLGSTAKAATDTAAAVIPTGATQAVVVGKKIGKAVTLTFTSTAKKTASQAATLTLGKSEN